jgi:hypothetical protein
VTGHDDRPRLHVSSYIKVHLRTIWPKKWSRAHCNGLLRRSTGVSALHTCEKHRLTETCHRLEMMLKLVLLVLKCLGSAKRHVRVSNMSRLVVGRCRCQSMQKNHQHNCIRCLRVAVGPFVRSLKSGSPVSHRLCYSPDTVAEPSSKACHEKNAPKGASLYIVVIACKSVVTTAPLDALCPLPRRLLQLACPLLVSSGNVHVLWQSIVITVSQ